MTSCTDIRCNVLVQVYRETTGAYKSLDKYYGRTLTDETFCDVLREFLHNGREMRSELLAPILIRLHALLNCLKDLSSFRFYASSLLIIYDGLCTTNPECSPEQSTGVDQNSTGSPKRDRSGKKGTTGESLSEHRLQGSPKLRGDVKSEQCVTHPTACGSRDSLAESSDLKATSTTTLTDSCVRCSLAASRQSSENGNAVSEPLASVDVRMIDFAHTTHSGFHDDEVVHEGPDRDYMWGLQNLIDLFSQLQEGKS